MLTSETSQQYANATDTRRGQLLANRTTVSSVTESQWARLTETIWGQCTLMASMTADDRSCRRDCAVARWTTVSSRPDFLTNAVTPPSGRNNRPTWLPSTVAPSSIDVNSRQCLAMATRLASVSSSTFPSRIDVMLGHCTTSDAIPSSVSFVAQPTSTTVRRGQCLAKSATRWSVARIGPEYKLPTWRNRCANSAKSMVSSVGRRGRREKLNRRSSATPWPVVTPTTSGSNARHRRHTAWIVTSSSRGCTRANTARRSSSGNHAIVATVVKACPSGWALPSSSDSSESLASLVSSLSPLVPVLSTSKVAQSCWCVGRIAVCLTNRRCA
eukprot:m.226238 g.226238  ORF g.226238 m.226238 type:complete len:328 (+) comp25926_c0_seq1:1184-2167(+)